MNVKKFVPTFFLSAGRIYADREGTILLSETPDSAFLCSYANAGADAACLLEFSETDSEHEKNLVRMKELIRESEIPVYAGGFIRRFEDVKKYLYTGADKVIAALSGTMDSLKEASARFGSDKLFLFADENTPPAEIKETSEWVSGYYAAESWAEMLDKPVLFVIDGKTDASWLDVLQKQNAFGITGSFVSALETPYMEWKLLAQAQGISVKRLVPKLVWSDFKLNSDGMLPVIVQDYRTSEVLMLAYMNEEAFQKTLETGKMTYWSRSRNELWEKGLTSGHFQYVKSLKADCDQDTLLAKVSQTGAACHTGAYSCFFQEVVTAEYRTSNPLEVLEHIFDIIADRKIHPRKGSYTNYLFDKGIDKILKKVGEEATEIVIAAKNPDAEEIKYEISDFLYHVMVLMVEKGVTWSDITKELVNR